MVRQRQHRFGQAEVVIAFFDPSVANELLNQLKANVIPFIKEQLQVRDVGALGESDRNSKPPMFPKR